jgi:hypothetical protein
MRADDYRAALSKVALVPSDTGRAMLAGAPPPVLASIERIERLLGDGPAPQGARPRLDPGATR